jgi:ribonuclease P/MRP protein subunit RPP40
MLLPFEKALIWISGNVLMLSEGQPAVDNMYSLKEGMCSISLHITRISFNVLATLGILTLHLDKESYERAGLAGKPEGVKGTRGTKPRWSMS